jgi:hypothetical protein
MYYCTGWKINYYYYYYLKRPTVIGNSVGDSGAGKLIIVS